MSNMVRTESAWKDKAVADNYLTGTRNAIPFAGEQLKLISALVNHTKQPILRFLDIGTGDGVMAHYLLDQFPKAEAIVVDFSDQILDACKKRLESYGSRVTIVKADLTSSEWKQSFDEGCFLDADVSGFCIHHLTHGRKYELYEEIYALLRPKGIFLNLEHVASQHLDGEALFDQLFVESLIAYEQTRDNSRTVDEVRSAYDNRADKEENKLLSVVTQCEWLREIGYEKVDIHFKWLELSLFGGVKPYDI